MSDEFVHDEKAARRGQILFAIGFVIVSLILLDVLGQETTWKKGAKLFAQARFWPAVGVGGMSLFGLLYLYYLPRKRVIRADLWEATKWLSVFEFAAWFMLYVWLVPILGYLPVTLVFAPALTWRMGYRSRGMLWASVAFAVVVVVLFKGFLQVKIPGAVIYEFLPSGVNRNFFILYL